MSDDNGAPLGPPQVREYVPDDPLTHAQCRGDLLCDRLTEVGALESGPILDLGCGYGGITLALRQRGHEVWSLDRDWSNIEVAHARLGAAGEPTLTTNASAVSLPFRSGAFQTVLMVGVLEWVGFSSLEHEPRDLQLMALREVRRVLRPGGRLILATKNRLFPRFAWSDAQLGLPLVNVLPRSAADQAVRRLRGYGYRSRIYSARGWSRMMAAADLTVEGGWTPRYTYQYPLALLPFSSRGSTRPIVEQRLQDLDESERREAERSTAQGPRSRFYDAIEAAGVHRHLAAGFVFSATAAG